MKKAAVISIASVFLLMFIYIFVEPFWIEVVTTRHSDPDVPREFDGFRIVFISDIHHGPFFSVDRIGKVVESVNSLSPDVVILGGDYVEKADDYVEPCFEALSKLVARFGVFAVLGNHDHRGRADRAKASIMKAGFCLVDNTSEWITVGGARIKIGGVGDFNEDTQDLSRTIFDVDPRDFVILVSHNPDYLEELLDDELDRVDLMLSGHTHGGQVTFFGLFAPMIVSRYGQKYRTGSYYRGDTRMIISNGVGTTALPIRFFARPQINVIELASP